MPTGKGVTEVRKPRILEAFCAQEAAKAHALLAARVAYMMGRKMEEADWSDVYCRAKGIPNTGWSNLHIDVVHEGLGVEHKMLCYGSRQSILEACGETLLHPSATRSIRVPSTSTRPQKAMRQVLDQYNEWLEERAKSVAETSPTGQADMRTGWLLWQVSLREFLYFEEEILLPDPSDYTAKWITRSSSGIRKESTSLWIYEKETGRKRYSVTTSAGAKIQPYFDVPGPETPGVYVFIVQGEIVDGSRVRIWIPDSTARELESIVGSLGTDEVSSYICRLRAPVLRDVHEGGGIASAAKPVLLTVEAYAALQEMFPSGVSDAHRAQMLVEYAVTSG